MMLLQTEHRPQPIHRHCVWCAALLLAGLSVSPSIAAPGFEAASVPAPIVVEPTPSELSRLVFRIAGQNDPAARVEAAVLILQTFSDEGVKAIGDILEAKNNDAAKLAICQAIAQVQSNNPALIPSLVALLDDKEPALREAAAAALSGYQDPAVTSRLQEQERQLLEKRFMAVCKQLYAMLPTDADRVAQLQRWLKSTLTLERVTALEIIHDKMSTGNRPTPEVLQQIRQMLGDRDERVRQRVIVALRDMRQPEDAPRVQAMLGVERSPVIREEIYKALGYLADPASIPVCVAGLQEPSDAVAAQAAAALGRLGAKGQENPLPGIQTVIAALTQRAGQVMDSPALREQLIDAMAKIADPSFLPALRAHADASEKVPAVRQAALRGIGVAGDLDHVGLVIDRLVNDPDPGVREVAANALGKLGSRPEHLRVLRERMDPKAEPAAAVQNAVWEAYKLLFLKVLSPADRETSLKAWTESDPVTIGRRIELLSGLEKQMGGANADPQRLARVREQLGEAFLSVGRAADAAQAFARVLDVLASADSEAAERVSGKLLEAYLRTPAIDKAIALIQDTKDSRIRDALLGQLLVSIRKAGASNRATAIGILDRLAQMVPSRFGPDWARQFDEVRKSLPPTSQPVTTRP